jgi:fructoselysine and glucoselysine-specific PTS system IIA component
MRKFLIATHGSFSAGIRSSLEMITGSNDNVFIIQAYTDGNKAIEAELNEILSTIGDNDELLVFTDIAGGSITSEILRLAHRDNVYVISGVNLPLLLDIILADPDMPVDDVIESGISNAREQIVFVSKLMNSMTEK